MITIHFSPEYDTGVWSGDPARGQGKLGESYTGPMGLLSQLEVRLGLTAPDKSSVEMLAAYLKAAQKAVAQAPDIFFKESLELSPLATAEELLTWRDELILAGWSKDVVIPEKLTSGAKAILEGLSKVECFIPNGIGTTSERWRGLISTLEKGAPRLGFRIVLHAGEGHLHPAHRRVLELLRKNGVTVDMESTGSVPKISLEHYRDSVDACFRAAAHGGESLLVCSDDQTLAAAQTAFGHRPGNLTASQAPRPVEHIFTSAMMLLMDGSDIHLFRDWLSSPSHPLNAYKKDNLTLRYMLLRNTVHKRGFDNVDKIVEDFAGGDADKLNEIREWLPDNGKPLTFERVKKLCKMLSEWAKRSIKANSGGDEGRAYVEQWTALSHMCAEMEFQCREQGLDTKSFIPEGDFLQILSAVSAPAESRYLQAVVGSAPVVSSIAKIAVPVKDVIWVDGAFEEAVSPMSFICREDVMVLEGTLPFVWTQKDSLLLQDNLFMAGLSRITGTLTILCCDSFRGEKSEKHQYILMRLKEKGMKGISELPYTDIPKELSEVCNPVSAKTDKETYDLNPDGLAIPGHESPSTLEGMFEQPLDWVLQSVLRLGEEGDTNMSVTEGLVAHDIINRICIDAGGTYVSADAFEDAFNKRFDEFFDEAVRDTGAELTLRENTLEREQFRSALKNLSLPRLITFLRSNAFTIVGSELRFEDVDISEPDFEPLHVTGVIDMLLRNSSDHYFVLDFKWAGSTGRDSRENEIKKGTDYQLALYRKVVELGGVPSVSKGEVAGQAYFMLRTAEVLTSCDGLFLGKDPVIPVPPYGKKPGRMEYGDTILDMHSRYSETVRAFRAGIIPAGNMKDPYLKYKVLKGKLN